MSRTRCHCRARSSRRTPGHVLMTDLALQAIHPWARVVVASSRSQRRRRRARKVP